MTIATVPACGPSFNDAYALFSPDAKRARTEVVVTGPPPGSVGEFSVRSVEMRQQPYAPWLRQLDTFTSLGANWDSYGASPIARQAILTAASLLTDLSFQPLSATFIPFHIAPTPVGGVVIEWRRTDGAGTLELWIDADGAMSSIVDRPFSEPRFQEGDPVGLGSAVNEIKTFAA